MRHDGPKNSFAYHAKQVFNNVEIEPELQPLEGEPLEMKSTNRQDDARSDVRVKSFWSRQRNAFFEFRVFYPLEKKLQNSFENVLDNRICSKNRI